MQASGGQTAIKGFKNKQQRFRGETDISFFVFPRWYAWKTFKPFLYLPNNIHRVNLKPYAVTFCGHVLNFFRNNAHLSITFKGVKGVHLN